MANLLQQSGLGLAIDSASTSVIDNLPGLSMRPGAKVKPTGTPAIASSGLNPGGVESKRLPGFDLPSKTLDSEWMSRAFCVSDADLGWASVKNKDGSTVNKAMPTPVLADNTVNPEWLSWLAVSDRYTSTASLKFTDTKLGGAIGVNARPQYTPYSDIRVKGKSNNLGRTNVSVQNANTGYGMGRYYSEAIDDTAQRIYLRFGVPQFNTLTNFVSGAFNLDTAYYARTGRKSIARALGVGFGAVVGMVAFPAISLLMYGAEALHYLFANPTSKYYTLKPTMYMYWSTVNSLVNTIAVTKGLFPTNTPGFKPGPKSTQQGNPQGAPLQLDKLTLEYLHNLMPDVFTEKDGFDIYAMANRAQREAYARFREDYDAKHVEGKGQMTGAQYFSRQISALDPTGLIAQNTSETIAQSVGTNLKQASDWANSKLSSARLVNFIANQVEKTEYFITKSTGIGSEIMPTVSADNGAATGITASSSWISSYATYLDAELRDGASFACFQIAATGSANESFSNDVGQSALANKVNSMGSTVRELRFDTEDGNLMGGVGEIIKNVATAATDVVAGVASGASHGITDGIVAMLTGAGFVDIPKHWESSSASLNRSSYTMQLISPYNNIISQMQNIFIPLSMIMAGSLPLSAGKQAYTSPFLCQLFDRGRCQIQLGIIDSLSITRGTSNLPFNLFGEVLAIDVTFTIKDLSNLMHMPISPGGLFDPDPSVNTDNILNDFIAVLAGQDIYSQIYSMPRAQMRAAKAVSNFNQMTSPARWASMTNDSITNGLMKYLIVPSLVKDAVAGSGTVSNGSNTIVGATKPIN